MELDALDEFNNRADEILHYIWDPIGVAGAVMARDEYSGYVPKLVTLLMANSLRVPSPTISPTLERSIWSFRPIGRKTKPLSSCSCNGKQSWKGKSHAS